MNTLACCQFAALVAALLLPFSTAARADTLTNIVVHDDRIEATLKQCLRVASTQGHEEPEPAARANMILCYVIGRWHQFAKSGFKRRPTEGFDAQAPLLI